MIAMASNSRKSYFTSQTSHRFLPMASHKDYLSVSMDNSGSAFEFDFDESQIYDSARSNSFEFRRSLHGRGSASAKKKTSSSSSSSGPAVSVPVNIPDWSKILGDQYRRRNSIIDEHEEEEEDEEEDYDVERSVRVPPHEFLARTRVASFSVQEGVGRTLKGRDLSTVRNAIWAKTGFQD